MKMHGDILSIREYHTHIVFI